MAGVGAKRVTLGALGLAATALAGLAGWAAACAPGHGANAPGPPFVVAVLAARPADPGDAVTLYETPNASACPGRDRDGGGGATGAVVPVATTFRVVLSELIDGDRVEPLDDAGLGTALAAGIATLVDPAGGVITSALDPSLTLGPGALAGRYQPAGGNGCFGTAASVDPVSGAPAPGPALLLALAPGLPSLPAGRALRLVIDGTVPDHAIVDLGGAALVGGVATVDFTTAPMAVDCPALASCNVAPLPDPTAPIGAERVRSVRVGFTAPVGAAAGLALYAGPAPAAGVIAVRPADAPFALDLVAGTAAAPAPLALAPGVTYWVMATDAVVDPWGVAATVACACADGSRRCCAPTCGAADCGGASDVCCQTRCAAAAAAGLDATGCIWAGAFTTAAAPADGGLGD
jgi:hypothetical protein